MWHYINENEDVLVIDSSENIITFQDQNWYLIPLIDNWVLNWCGELGSLYQFCRIYATVDWESENTVHNCFVKSAGISPDFRGKSLPLKYWKYSYLQSSCLYGGNQRDWKYSHPIILKQNSIIS